MKKVFIFAPFEMKSGYRGGVLHVIQEYLQNKDTFSSNGYDIQYNDFSSNTYDQYYNYGALKKCIYHLGYIRRYCKILIQKSKEYDIIHIHTSRDIRLFEDLIIANKLKRKVNIPIVVSIHRAELCNTITKNSCLQKIFLYLMKKMDQIVFLSQNTQREFIERGISENNTSYLPTFHSYPSIPYNRGVSKHTPFRLLFVGFFGREKGLVELLTAMTQLPDNFVLDLCGGTKDCETIPEAEILIQQLGNRVIQHGFVTGDKKKTLFENASAFILPSYGEGMPLVILEALHFSLPVIVTRVGSIPEILEEERNVIYIDIGSSKDIVAAAEKLYSNPEYCRKMGENNGSISSEYSVVDNIKRLCAIYDKV